MVLHIAAGGTQVFFFFSFFLDGDGLRIKIRKKNLNYA